MVVSEEHEALAAKQFAAIGLTESTAKCVSKVKSSGSISFVENAEGLGLAAGKWQRPARKEKNC